MQRVHGDYVFSTDPDRLDVDLIHRFLSRDSYWAEGIPREVVERSLMGSLNIGAFLGEAQVAFARVVTDYATFAYLADVFVVPAHRRRGLSKVLVEMALGHPQLQGLRRWMLATFDAHGLYAQFGFRVLDGPERWMEIRRTDVYPLES